MSLLLAFAVLFPTALAADGDGDGVDGATDCDDSNPLVYKTENSSARYSLSTSGVASFCTGYCSRDVGEIYLTASTTTGLECLQSVDTLDIYSSSLTSLSGLGGLEEAGSISLWNTGLADLSGLRSLTALRDLYIGCNGTPSDLSGLTWEEIEEEMSDAYCGSGSNPSLTSLNGLGGVTSLRTLGIWSTKSLTSLGGLNNLTDAKTVLLYNVDGLTSLAGLDGLTTVDSLMLMYSDGLTSLAGLGALESAGGVMMAGLSLSSLRGLEGLSTLDGLYLSRMTKLNSLTGLEGLSTIGEVQLHSVPMLRDMHGLDNVTYVKELTITMADNLTSLEGLESAEKISTLRLGCVTPEGELGVMGCWSLPKLASLEALSGTTGIGTLSLVNLPALTSLSGLDGLTYLGNLVLDATVLEDLNPLSGVVTAGGQYEIGCHVNSEVENLDSGYYYQNRACLGNPSLVSLDGLDNVTTLSTLRIVNNQVLDDVSALENLTKAYVLEIANNPALADLSVIGAPVTTASIVRLGCYFSAESEDYDSDVRDLYYACPGASAATSLPRISSASLRTLELNQMPLITSLDGIASMTTASIVTLDGLGLTDLTGLAGLGSATMLWIGCHPWKDDSEEDYLIPDRCSGMSALTSLDGLEALKTVGDLRVVMNHDLSDIDALTGLTLADDVTFRNNYSLSTSYINTTIAAIDRVTGTKTVSGNAP